MPRSPRGVVWMTYGMSPIACALLPSDAVCSTRPCPTSRAWPLVEAPWRLEGPPAPGWSLISAIWVRLQRRAPLQSLRGARRPASTARRTPRAAALPAAGWPPAAPAARAASRLGGPGARRSAPGRARWVAPGDLHQALDGLVPAQAAGDAAPGVLGHQGPAHLVRLLPVALRRALDLVLHLVRGDARAPPARPPRPASPGP